MKTQVALTHEDMMIFRKRTSVAAMARMLKSDRADAQITAMCLGGKEAWFGMSTADIEYATSTPRATFMGNLTDQDYYIAREVTLRIARFSPAAHGVVWQNGYRAALRDATVMDCAVHTGAGS